MSAPAAEARHVERPENKKRKFVREGLFYAELNEFLTRELGQDGYAGVAVRSTAARTHIVIHATRTQNVRGDKGRRIREIKSLVQKRFNLSENNVSVFAERVENRALCAVAQAESLRFKLQEGLAVRRACYGVIRYIMENGAKGCEVLVSGKLRGQRAKGMKFLDGYMVKSGERASRYVDRAVRHLKLKQGVIGIAISIMKPYDPRGENGAVTVPLADVVTVSEPKEDEESVRPATGANQVGFATNFDPATGVQIASASLIAQTPVA